MRRYRMLGVATAFCIAISTIFSGTATVSADTTNVYIKQDSQGFCTLAAAAMMMRQKALNEGNSTWNNITQKNLLDSAWISDRGLRHSFNFYGIGLKYSNFDTDDIKSRLISLLNEHPEGIAIYERSVPHAVFLTNYDEFEDVFYCADPALSTNSIMLKDSWLKTMKSLHLTSEKFQDTIVESLDGYWYISSYNTQNIPAIVKSDSNSNTASDKPNNNYSNDNDKSAFSKLYDIDDKEFIDLDKNEWYYDYICTAYNNGLMNGVDSTYFKPDSNITIVQSVTIAARMHSIYNKNGESFEMEPGDMWYDPYFEYAIDENIIKQKYLDSEVMNYTATKAEFAEILSAALPDKYLKRINDIKDGDIKDISISVPMGEAVYKLCKAGVITGNKGYFKPSENITRAQAAAVIARMADPAQRVKL